MRTTDVHVADIEVQRFRGNLLASCGRKMIDLAFRLVRGTPLTDADYSDVTQLRRDIHDALAVLHAVDHNRPDGPTKDPASGSARGTIEPAAIVRDRSAD